MKILHITSDTKPGGIQKAFEAYLSVLSAMPQFENIYFTPNRVPFYERQYNARHLHMSWMQKTLLRRAAYLPIQKLHRHSFEIGLAHNGFICTSIQKYCKHVIGICHNDKPAQFKDADHLICLTPNAVQQAKELGRDNNTIHMLPHYFEPQTKSSVTSNPSVQANSKVTIGAAGRFVEKKGFKTFIDAAAKIRREYPETEFLLAGDGSLSTQLRSYAEQSGNPVRFTGWVDIENFAPSIDIFCLPSLDEPFGYILAEMMHHGVAIIATRTNGPLWICEEDENALFFQPSDSNELAHCLRTLITDPQKRLRYQHNAIKAINDKRFSKQAFAEHLFSIISKITKNQSDNQS